VGEKCLAGEPRDHHSALISGARFPPGAEKVPRAVGLSRKPW
jgi:hypothetical protein